MILALAGQVWRGAGQVGRGVLDLLLPPQCLTCDVVVDAPGRLCVACFRETGFVTAPMCVCCGVPFEHDGQGDAAARCSDCRRQRPVFNAARAALRYDERSSRVILAFKHGDKIEMQRGLVPMMARAGATLLAGADVLVPVPLHRRRLFSRRYNQAAILADGLAQLAGRRVVLDALIRHRATPMLGHLSATERASTVQGVFAVRPSRRAALTGRRVVLIDDVMTSGATANECARTLLAAGVANVDVLVAARAGEWRWRP